MTSTPNLSGAILRAAAAASVAVWLSLTPSVSGAKDADVDLLDLSLDDLMKVRVTSVSKREQPLSEAAAAVYVITGEEIRRSGVTSIPEALRLAPGLHVARIGSSRWVVTSRGFNSRFATKLLVLIDGRSVYSPLFAGVFWDVQDTVLEDIDRIEVVRGPGGTLWGANAVNGVINIITKRAAETQGWLLLGGGGSFDRAFGTLRYGTQLGGNASLRGNVKYVDNASSETESGDDAQDEWKMVRGGFRLDWDLSPNDVLTVQGDYYDGEEGGILVTMDPGHEDPSGGNILSRWHHTFSDTSHLSLQFYYDRTERLASPVIDEDRDTVDFELQHRFAPLPSHDLVWGAGYRLLKDRIGSTPILTVTPSRREDDLVSFFVQDQITLFDDRLQLTLGSKFEHNSYTGFEFQPTGRVLWKPEPRHSIWAAVSRAVRTPSRVEHDMELFTMNEDPPALVLLTGNRAFESEELIAYELGYRAQLSPDFSFDLATYYNDYDDLRGAKMATVPLPTPPYPPGTLEAPFDNDTTADGYGLEVVANWAVTDRWLLSSSYTLMMVDVEADARDIDVLDERQAEDTPKNQFQIKSRMNLPHRFEFDTSLFYVGDVGKYNTDEYVRLDVRLGWRPIESVELSIVGQNLTEQRHEEFGTGLFYLHSSVPRSVYGKITLRH